MMKLLRKKRSPIGIDIGRKFIKAIQLESARDGIIVAAATSMPRSGTGISLTPAEARQLSDVLARQSFIGNDIILAATGGLVTSRLELPPITGQAPLDQLTRIELARSQKCDPTSFEMGCWNLPAPARAQKATHVMAVALPHTEAEMLIAGFESQGLNVCALDIKACALARALLPLTDSDGITAILDIGWESADLSLLFKGAIIYGRSLTEAGIASMYDALRARVRVDAEAIDYLVTEVGLSRDQEDAPADAHPIISSHFESAGRELLASFSYATHQYPDAAVKRILVVGGGAAIPGVVAHLGGVLGIETQNAAPAALVTCGSEIMTVCSSPSLTLALGLSQYPEL